MQQNDASRKKEYEFFGRLNKDCDRFYSKVNRFLS